MTAPKLHLSLVHVTVTEPSAWTLFDQAKTYRELPQSEGTTKQACCVYKVSIVWSTLSGLLWSARQGPSYLLPPKDK